MRIPFSSLFLALCVFISSSLFAHSFDSERVIMIDSTKEKLEILITYREAPGRRLDYLMGIYDKNQNGFLSKSESISVTPVLKKIALKGLVVSLPLAKEEVRVKYKRKEGLSIALFYELPKKVKTLTFELSKNEKHLWTQIRFIGDGLSMLNGICPTQDVFSINQGRFGIYAK